MKIIRRKQFKKMYRRLSQKQRDKVDRVLGAFVVNPRDAMLENNALKGVLRGKRALVVEFDLRIVFIERDDYEEVVFVGVGTHDQVYRK